MSADKQTRALNRFHDFRVTRNQTAIYLLYNGVEWLAANKQPGFRKRKAMNCSCRTCRGWDREAKQFRFNLQLEKQGMCEKHQLRRRLAAGRVTKEWSDEYEGF
ncbi:hypothetical protein [Pseudomonas phage D6]|nr:hypothetical protein [Pseudomonas phage D6]